MSWRDGLLPASFRGVSFFFDDTSLEGGRRLAEHEFPLRDEAFVEDMGKRNRRYSIAAYVLGDGYMAERDALLAALEAEGSATLQHPYLGVLTVNVDRVRMRETRDEGGMARFDIEFFDAGINPSPTSDEDTADGAMGAGDDAFDQFGQSFEGDWDAGGDLDFIASLLGDLQILLIGLLSWPGVDTSAIAGLLIEIATATSDAVAIAKKVTAFLSGYSDAVVNSYIPFDENTSSRGPLPVTDPTYGLATLATWGGGLDIPVGAARKKNQAAMVALVGGSAAAGLVQLYARTQFSAQDDADVARATVVGIIDTLTDTASNVGDDDASAVLQALSVATSADLTARGKQTPSTIFYSLNGVLPALVLAQRFYDDPDRAGELVARNLAQHPLFMPVQVEVLSS